MKLTGAQIVMECLKEQKVDTVFGYPGGTILNIYDELYKYSDSITHILTSHEQGASHAADGYARATGKVGVCFATSGPGSTNLVTGIATAYMDSIPVVAITANVGINLIGKDSFQEIDIKGITMPITKHNYIVKDVKDLADTIRRAFVIAQTGRKGPVLVDITKNVTADKCEYTYKEPEVVKPLENKIEEASLDEAVKLIAHAKRPFVLVGGGAVACDAGPELKKFVDKIQAPVADTLMGKGAFNGNDPAYTGMIGMHGTKTSNLGVSNCDLLIAVGVRFSDRVVGNASTFAKKAKIIHIDVDPAEIDKNIMVNCSIIGDAKVVLRKLNARIDTFKHEAWMKQIEEYRNEHSLHYDHKSLTGPAVVEAIYELTKGDAIICTDVGQHQMWAAQFFKYDKPRKLITSGGLGTMGYGLGAAIGAKIGCPDKLVFNIAGDGCFRMNMNELATASRYNVPVIEVVINNHVLGMVRQWQTLFYGKRYSATIINDKVDFVKVAEALGCYGIKVTSLKELKPAIKKAMELNAPVVIDCIIDKDDKVWPMVAPGASIAEAFSDEDMQGNKKASKEQAF